MVAPSRLQQVLERNWVHELRTQGASSSGPSRSTPPMMIARRHAPHNNLMRPAFTPSLRFCTAPTLSRLVHFLCGVLAARPDHLLLVTGKRPSSKRQGEATDSMKVHTSLQLCSARWHGVAAPCRSRTTICCVSMSQRPLHSPSLPQSRAIPVKKTMHRSGSP